ncbi:MAG TPA: hypothetical protein VHE34_21245 [Puia sp.]|uniref:hypothetical protein n=1 Tax=Puia sp. TaxID=2045100 RepID=UPI002B623041|nr:hypothetical protein [Puia sp.]HVU97770.1 hypothetical protein [Puia sp.]
MWVDEEEILNGYKAIFKMKKKVVLATLYKLFRERAPFVKNRGPMINTMMDLIFEMGLLKVLPGGKSKRDIEHIIRLKTNDVFCETFRIPKKKLPLTDHPPEAYDLASGEPDPYQRLVLREDMQAVTKLMSETQLSIMENVADEVDREAMQARLKLSETALNNRILRLRQRLQKRLTKGY